MSEWRAFEEILPEIGRLMTDDPERGYERVERRWARDELRLPPAEDWRWLFVYDDGTEYRIKPRTTRLQEECRKPIDLSVCVNSGIDMECSYHGIEWWPDTVGSISKHGCYWSNAIDDWVDYARPRMSHWMAWMGGKCPLPEGVRAEIRYRDGIGETAQAYCRTWEHSRHPRDIIAYKVIGLADGYFWPWEMSDE